MNIKAHVIIIIIVLLIFLFGFSSGILISRKVFFEQGKKYMFDMMLVDGK